MKFDKRLGPVKVFTDQNAIAQARVLDTRKAKVICLACGRDTAQARRDLGVRFGQAATLTLDGAAACTANCYLRANLKILPSEVTRLLREALESQKSFPVFVDSGGALLVESSPAIAMISRLERARKELRAKGCTRY